MSWLPPWSWADRSEWTRAHPWVAGCYFGTFMAISFTAYGLIQTGAWPGVFIIGPSAGLLSGLLFGIGLKRGWDKRLEIETDAVPSLRRPWARAKEWFLVAAMVLGVLGGLSWGIGLLTGSDRTRRSPSRASPPLSGSSVPRGPSANGGGHHADPGASLMTFPSTGMTRWTVTAHAKWCTQPTARSYDDRVMRRLWWTLFLAGALAAAIGVIAFHHETGATFQVQLAPASPPPLPQDCHGPCAQSWHQAAWFRGTVTNVGHRGANMVCTAEAFDPNGQMVYSRSLPTWSFPGGPFVEAGATHSWTARIPSGDRLHPLGPLARMVGSCWAIDYHGNRPV
jgi:hypothetical protein